jgi:phosphonate transport system substrate-binding protein
MKRSLKWVFTVMFVLVLASANQGCQPRTGPRPTTNYLELTPIPTVPTPTFRPTYTPTPLPLGDPANPIIMGFIASEASSEQTTAANDLTRQLSQALGLQITAQIFPTYNEFERSLRSGSVQIAWLESVEYILASKSGSFKAGLLTNHLGITALGIQFFAHKDSGFTSFFDIAADQSTANAVTALAQFSGMRPCLVNDNSLSAYWVPLGLLTQVGVVMLEPSYTNSTTANIRALYIKGVCDFTGTYALSGDPRTASAITTDLPDVMQQIIIIWRSDALIPNLSLSFSNKLDLPLQKQLQEALIALSRTPEGLKLLSDATAYSIEALEPTEDTAYDELRSLLEIQKVNLRTLVDQ